MQIYAHLGPAAANGVRIVDLIFGVPDGKVPGRDLDAIPAGLLPADCVPCASEVAAGMVFDAAEATFSVPVPPPLDLATVKAALKRRVDGDAEDLRLLLITPGSGQAMEYQEAYAEAAQVDAALKANPSATFAAADYPMLSASLGYDLDPSTDKPTTDLPGEARAVLAAYEAYQKAGAAIREARLKAKAAIDAAADAADAQTAFTAVVWPTLG